MHATQAAHLFTTTSTLRKVPYRLHLRRQAGQHKPVSDAELQSVLRVPPMMWCYFREEKDIKGHKHSHLNATNKPSQQTAITHRHGSISLQNKERNRERKERKKMKWYKDSTTPLRMCRIVSLRRSVTHHQLFFICVTIWGVGGITELIEFNSFFYDLLKGALWHLQSNQITDWMPHFFVYKSKRETSCCESSCRFLPVTSNSFDKIYRHFRNLPLDTIISQFNPSLTNAKTIYPTSILPSHLLSFPKYR